METLVGTRMKKCRAAGPGGLDGPGQGAGHYPAGNGERQALKRGGRGGQSVVRSLWLCVCSGLWQGTRAGAVSKWVGGAGGRVSWDEVREWHGHIYTTKCKIDS